MQQDILIITRNFPPIIGGMEKLMWHAYLNLGNRYRITLIGPRGSSAFIDAPHRCIECNEQSPMIFLLQALASALKACRSTQFAFCVGGSGVIGPVCQALHIFKGLPTLLFLHGLDIIADSIIYQRIFVPSLRGADLLITNSANTTRLAQQAGIDTGKIRIVYPGVESALIETQGIDLREDLDLANADIILSVGRLIKRKGVLEFIRFSLPKIVRECPNVVFLVIGDEPSQALKKEDPITEQIESAIKQNQLDKHVRLLGKVSDDVLCSAYECAEAFIFPIMDLPGDVEGFGIVAVEAAAFGVPTIAFDAGGVADAVKSDETGVLVAPNDYDAMASAVIQGIMSNIRARMSQQCIEHSRTLSWEQFGEQVVAHSSHLVTNPDDQYQG